MNIKEYQQQIGKTPTIISSHGANPGLVSSFVKQALVNIARDTDAFPAEGLPKTSQQWAKLASDLGVKLIQISEKDSQVSNIRKKPNEFVGTWSIDGFIGEGNQPSELGWGTHEKHFPPDGRHFDFGCGSSIYLDRPSFCCKARSWTPCQGDYHGYIITHNECVSLSDFLTVKNERNEVIYRPTVHYAYHPCNDSMLSVLELSSREFNHHDLKYRFLMNDIVEGMDELGVLICGHKKNAYWWGSPLNIEEVRKLVPYHNCTSLQVTIGALSGVISAIENPNQGFLESEDLDFVRILEIAKPYLGQVGGVYTDWDPLKNRSKLFREDIDHDDPWQFKNIRVN